MPRFPHPSATNDTLSAGIFSEIAQRLRGSGGRGHRLHVGDTWREPVAAARAEAQLTSERPGLHTYSPVHGEPELLDAIVRRLARRSDLPPPERDAIQVTVGATGGLSVTCQTLLDPGDEVLLPAPYWPLIRGIIASRGATPVEIPFYDRLGGATFDPERALEAAIGPRTVAIYVNSPHNPTGVVLDDESVAAIARVAARHDLWVLCDEVYEDIWYGDSPPMPVWARRDLRDRAIAVHSLSKGYGLAGARVGYLHGPADVVRAIRAVHTFQVYGAAKPMQLGAARALEEGDAWLSETRALYREASRRTARALGLPPPAGGTFLFFDASPWLDGAPDATPLLLRCVDRGLLLTPGAASGRDYASWVRVCYTAVPPDELDRALAILHDILGTATPKEPDS